LVTPRGIEPLLPG